jgi:hypothetical protein
MQTANRKPQTAILSLLALFSAQPNWAARVQPAVERELQSKGSANIAFTLPVSNPGIFFDRGGYQADQEVKTFVSTLSRLGESSRFKATYRVFNRYGWGVAQIGPEDLDYLRSARELADVELASRGSFQDVEASQAAQITALATGSPAYNGAGVKCGGIGFCTLGQAPGSSQPAQQRGDCAGVLHSNSQ